MRPLAPTGDSSLRGRFRRPCRTTPSSLCGARRYVTFRVSSTAGAAAPGARRRGRPLDPHGLTHRVVVARRLRSLSRAARGRCASVGLPETASSLPDADGAGTLTEANASARRTQNHRRPQRTLHSERRVAKTELTTRTMVTTVERPAPPSTSTEITVSSAMPGALPLAPAAYARRNRSARNRNARTRTHQRRASGPS